LPWSTWAMMAMLRRSMGSEGKKAFDYNGLGGPLANPPGTVDVERKVL
jgi:hypothetical protein